MTDDERKDIYQRLAGIIMDACDYADTGGDIVRALEEDDGEETAAESLARLERKAEILKRPMDRLHALVKG